MKVPVHSRTFWCDTCHVPLLGKLCHACGVVGRDLSSAAFVPVFRPEINYLKKRVIPELHSFLHELETWVTPTNYTYYGHGAALFRLSATTADVNSYATLKRSRHHRRSREETLALFQKANKIYVEQMQYEAEHFIRETVRTHRGRPVLVSFSGGKDSTVTSHLVMNALGRSDILHVFADTKRKLT